MFSVLSKKRSKEAGSLRTGTRVPKQATVSVPPGFSICWPHHCYNAIKSFDSLLKVGHKETHLLVVACHEDGNLCLELEAGKPRDKFHMTQCRLHSTTPASFCELRSSFLFFFYRLKHCLNPQGFTLFRSHQGSEADKEKENILDPMQIYIYIYIFFIKI